jgi:hypothetical protein
LERRNAASDGVSFLFHGLFAFNINRPKGEEPVGMKCSQLHLFSSPTSRWNERENYPSVSYISPPLLKKPIKQRKWTLNTHFQLHAVIRPFVTSQRLYAWNSESVSLLVKTRRTASCIRRQQGKGTLQTIKKPSIYEQER